jgi:hypothetical protein
MYQMPTKKLVRSFVRTGSDALPMSTKFVGQQSISRGGGGATAQNAHPMHGEAGVQWAQPSLYFPEIPPVDT